MTPIHIKHRKARDFSVLCRQECPEIKKMLEIHGMLVLRENAIAKQIFKARFHVFHFNIKRCSRNTYSSPIFEILSILIIFDVFNKLCMIIDDGAIPS